VQVTEKAPSRPQATWEAPCPELLVPVERDDAYMDRLLHEELEFWDKVQEMA
jgi:hypothetical protein